MKKEETKEEKVNKTIRQNREKIADNCYITFCWPPAGD